MLFPPEDYRLLESLVAMQLEESFYHVLTYFSMVSKAIFFIVYGSLRHPSERITENMVDASAEVLITQLSNGNSTMGSFRVRQVLLTF
jgi:hypothetical protein